MSAGNLSRRIQDIHAGLGLVARRGPRVVVEVVEKVRVDSSVPRRMSELGVCPRAAVGAGAGVLALRAEPAGIFRVERCSAVH